MTSRLAIGILAALAPAVFAFAQDSPAPAPAAPPASAAAAVPAPATAPVAPPTPVAATAAAAAPLSAAAKVILVRGADGEPEYAAKFDAQLEAWKKAAAAAGADVTVVHGPAGDDGADVNRLQKILTALPAEGPSEVWLILMGHGTFDGKEARFNLEGPDVSTTQLADWLKPLHRPLVVINTASCSAPFLNALAGPDRVIVTATRSGSEKNYARFGEYLASALEDAASDYDADGQYSLLEWVLTAATRTANFYKTEGRIASEHALIDDNGDGRGTPLEWFQGLRAVKKTKDNIPPDGDAASHLWLIPDDTTRRMPAEKRTARDTLEAQITTLRAKKPSLKENDYYRQLEDLLRQLASVYE